MKPARQRKKPSVRWKYWIGAVALLPAVSTSADVYYRDRHRSVYIGVPTESHTTINKTVRIYAPPGTTVIYGETPVYGTGPFRVPPGSYPPGYRGYAGLALRPESACLMYAGGPTDGDMAVAAASCADPGKSDALYFLNGKVRYYDACLQAEGSSSGSRVGAGLCRGSDTQDWLYAGNRLVNRNSGLCLQADDDGMLSLRPCSGSTTQQFR